MALLAGLASAGAVEVELRLVAGDRPDTTLDTLERRRPIVDFVPTEKGVESRQVGLELVCWARNVRLDGQPVFERYHEGKYVGRLPVARARLAPGTHTVWPGDHVFELSREGVVSTADPELLVDGRVVRVKCYPVTLRAYRANPAEGDLPMSMRLAPLPHLTVREAADHERAAASAEKGKRVEPRELLPEFGKFAPLTIWLPANAAGKGYLVHPLGVTLHLGGRGVRAAGAEGLRVGANEIAVPLFGYPVAGCVGAKLVVAGVEQFHWGGHDKGREFLTNWCPRRKPYELRVADDGPSIQVDGALRDLPVKRLAVDIPDPASTAQRVLLAEMATRHLKPGDTLRARVRVVPAAGLAPFAQLRPCDGGEWADLGLSAGDGGRVEVAVPRVADGVYSLRLGARPADGRGRAIAAEQWVAVAGERAAGVGLFTQRGRDAFYRGESFWLGVGVLARGRAVPAGAPLAVDLTDARGATLALYRGATPAAIATRETFILRVDAPASLALAPGRYRAVARVGGHASRARTLDVVDPEPASHFTTLMVGKYSAWGKHYQQALRSCRGAERLARELAATGCNAFKGMAYDLHRVNRRDLDLEQLVRERPALGPAESYYQPSGRDRFLNAAVRHNLRFYENIFTHNDTSLPREPRILKACERFLGLEVAALRHSPAFRGVCLYDEFYNSSDAGTSQAVIAAFFKAQEMAYRDKHPGMTSARAMKALDRFAGRPRGQRRYDDLARFRSWLAHQDSEWRDFSTRMAAVARDVAPASRNFTLMRFWGGNGGNLAPNGTPNDVFAGLDAAACVMYKDGGYGDRPVFAPMQADVLRVRDDLPVWTQLHTFHAPGLFGQHIVRQAFFALSQAIQGLSFFTIPTDHEAPRHFDSRDTTRDITARLCRPYGDLFLACRRGYRKVAIYYSREADYLTLRKPNKLAYACEGLWVACMRAGFPADFLYDHQIRAGQGRRYAVVFAPGFAYEDECPPDLLAELRRLAQAGTVLAAERSSKLPVDGLVRLDSALDEYDDKQGGAFPRNIDFESEMVWDQSAETTRLVRRFLAKHVPPAAEHGLLVGPDWLRCRDAHYLVIPNFKFTEFTGTHKTLYQAPDRPTLRFPRRPPACYDLLEGRRVDVATDGDSMTLQADLRHVPGKIYAFLPAAVGGVELRASRSVRAGADLHYRVAVADAAGKPIDAGFPLEIALRDAGGAVVHRVYRAAAPAFRGVCRVPVNVPTGRWTLRARELIAGTAAEAAVEVTKGKAPAARLDVRKVWVRDASHIRAFLAAKEPVLIAVGPDQAWVRKHAERLVQALAARGRQAKLVPVADAVRLPGAWSHQSQTIDGTRMWRGHVVEPGLFVDGPLVLLGKRRENRLVEALIRRDALAEPLSANFPGPGKAIVAWTRRAFSNDHDTVCVLANDAAGLSRGIDALAGVERQDDQPPVQPAVVRPEADPRAPLAPAVARAKQPRSLRDLLSAEDAVRCLDVEPATGRVLAGTHGYGHNLFCLGADGTLLWKTFLPEHHVYTAQWYDGGTRVVAATGRGFFVFLLDGGSGRVLKKFASTEWPRFHGGFNQYQEGAVDTCVPVVVNAAQRQILVGGLTGILAVDFDGRKMWFRDRAEAIAAYPAEAVQTAGASFGRTVVVGGFALSPDGSRLVHDEYVISGSTRVMERVVDMWAHRPVILDARTGKVLAQNADDKGSATRPGSRHVLWPAGSAEPWVAFGHVAAPLHADGTTGTLVAFDGRWLPDGGRLAADAGSVERLDASGKKLWRRGGDGVWLPELDRLSADGQRFLRCDREGRVRCLSTADGRVRWERKLPFSAVLHPVPDGVVAGAKNGLVARLDGSGQVAWQVRLRDLHERPGRDYPAYVRAALRRDPDATHEFFPVGRDRPGDYEGVLRFGLEQLANRGFEADGGWSAGARRGGPAHAGKSALALAPGQLVTQRLQRKIVPSATYLLEFHYRVEAEGATLTAGALLAGEKETLTASTFAARPGPWAFGRLAVKTLGDTRTLDVGFEAEGGAAWVDDASFRAVRFPSANLLANAELSGIEPTFVRDPRIHYDRIPGALRDRLMGQNHVAALKQGLSSTARAFLDEQAFLHNGRLDDVGSIWFYQPDSAGFSAVLARPAHVSHLVLYLNNATPANVYRQISIVANNLDTKLPQTVALVRGNRRRFVVVHFPELLHTDSLKILPGMHRARRECLTEIEIYGPLGGRAMAERGKRFPDDPLAVPMFMGGPTHVLAPLPADLVGTYHELGSTRMGAPALLAGATVAHGQFTFAEAAGTVRSLVATQPDPKGRPRHPVADGPRWRIGTITPTTTPARYAGRLLVGSADGKLHAVADGGTHLWAFRTDARVYSSPVPDGDEAYVGSDDGKLYKVDVDSGALIWEFATGGKVRSAPALADGRLFAASWDGHLYAVHAATGLAAWKAPVASYTRSSPAVHRGRVLVGDEEGRLHCFEAASGKPLWQRKVGGRISGCPVVAGGDVFVASEQGHAAVFGLDGAPRWRRELGTRVSGQPMPTRTQVLVPTERGLLVLRRADGRPDERFVPPPEKVRDPRTHWPGNPGKTVAVVPYGDKVFLLVAYAKTILYPPLTYAEYRGFPVLWAPKKADAGARRKP